MACDISFIIIYSRNRVLLSWMGQRMSQIHNPIYIIGSDVYLPTIQKETPKQKLITHQKYLINHWQFTFFINFANSKI